MIIIYRGMGILVPIVLFISGWIVSFWFKDTRIGNPDFMGWTLFYTAIVCLLLGLATFNTDEEQSGANGQRVRKKRAHFFYIPIVFWAPIFGGISAFLLLSSGKNAEDKGSEDVAASSVPVIHFYNPTTDTLDYLIYTKNGLSEQQSLEPYTSAKVEAPAKSYVLGALNTSGEATMTLPYYKEYDARLYENVKEGDRSVDQRLIRPLSKQPNDYEDNWMLLDGSYDMILVDVSELYDGTINTENTAKIDWMKKIKSRHEGTELIEFSIAPSTPGGSVYVSEPNTYLPLSAPKDRSVYMLITCGHDEEVSNDFIRSSVEHVTL